VIDADELLERVKRLLRSIDENKTSPRKLATSEPATPPSDLVTPVQAMQAVHADLHPPDLGRPKGVKGRVSRFVKRIVRRLTSWYIEPRWILQQDYDNQNIHQAVSVANQLQRLDEELDHLRAENVRLKLHVVSSVERLNRYRREVNDVLRDVARQDDVRTLNRELKRLGVAGTPGIELDYVAFEDRFRGSSVDVRQTQKRYLTLFPPPGIGKIIDIGCGRGEMLDLLLEAGYDVLGIDSDPRMIEACQAKGYPVVQEDGLTFLENADNDSLRGIFCAQVVEHLLTSELERLIEFSYQKLLKGGVLLVETINPRSQFALGNHFFADLSHVRPVHPETLRFICEQFGFSTVQLEERSAHPLMEMASDLPEGQLGTIIGQLMNSVFGFQDYVIIATK
jgi:2-polyprenyl-3-methyl-5-hydroxy-6-metoxy-1,4-benzoquinol methylase